ncbi:MAG: hypothetical protein HY654_13175 [Acidobacteria bacterium]|nr:hypothetical protein [Acidobacteriota bacterium]
MRLFTAPHTQTLTASAWSAGCGITAQPCSPTLVTPPSWNYLRGIN